MLPIADHLTESLDFTGRHERERTPQRRPVTDGLWLREGRGGRPGLDGTGMIVVGTPGFNTTAGEVVAVHVAWSGNTVLRIERDSSTGATIGGGELLLPGEMVLGPGDSYTTPWVFFATGDDGLDDIAASWHEWQRSLPAHPPVQPVIFNVWEAVYFDHDLARLQAIADRAARVGVELFVLDVGWFRKRRDVTSGLGDWWIDKTVWPDGLTPLIDHVHRLGMGFGIWFEPEMVNPDSDLLREHPDWLLAAGPHRAPELHRHQQALDLTRPEVWTFLYERMTAILETHPIDFVKWDHNRDLLEAGSLARHGAPAIHQQTQAFYRLLDALRDRFPAVAWESCAAGGGRVDFGVLERVQRVWTSDMTDALARQTIQRWSAQLVAPEYLGAHVSAPTSHATGRTLDLDFRCATALFGSFGVEWDLSQAADEELDRLAAWVARYRQLRGALALGAACAAGVHGPVGSAPRDRRGRPLGGARRARGPRRKRTQPRRADPCPRPPSGRLVRPHVGGASHGQGGQHVGAVAKEWPDRWSGDDRHSTGAPRVLDPAAATRKRDPYPADPPLSEAGASLRDIMSTCSVLVVGESVIDIVARPNGTVLEHAGGSAANVAVALARLGPSPSQFLTALGRR